MGRILTYRPPTQISISVTPGTNLSSYSFAGKQFEHKFCPICGVAVGVYDTIENMQGVNLRCFEGVEWVKLRLLRTMGIVLSLCIRFPDNLYAEDLTRQLKKGLKACTASGSYSDSFTRYIDCRSLSSFSSDLIILYCACSGDYSSLLAFSYDIFSLSRRSTSF